MLQDAECLGIDASALEHDTSFELWADHLPALEAFLEVSTQMRRRELSNGSAVFVGLDYAAAQAGLAMAGIDVTPALWGQVRLIEAGAIQAAGER